MALREPELIDYLRQRLPSHPRLLLGIGDDAALLDWSTSDRCVVSVDMLMDGVDFHCHQVNPRRIGHKALAINLSDLAAMAARPVAAVVSLALPVSMQREFVAEMYEGMLALAARHDVALAGGDINTWSAPLAISVTVLGEPTPQGALRRDGARPGDVVLVTGSFGGSILGRHLDVEPRVAEALWLRQHYELHAGIDVSDGLSLDLSRLAEASRCGAVLRLDDVPIAPAAHELAGQQPDGPTARDHALADGEDFELILAVPPDEAQRILQEQPLDVRVTAIGEFVAQEGLWSLDAEGNRRSLPPRGYEHHG